MYRIFLSTLSLRRATTGLGVGLYLVTISIHALLAESDNFCVCIIELIEHFYPRSPCGERRVDEIPYQRQINQFLSTLSLRRATGKVRVVEPGFEFLSTLSLRRAT